MIHIIVYAHKAIGIQSEDNLILINPTEDIRSESSKTLHITTSIFTTDCKPWERKNESNSVKRSYIDTHCLIEIITPSKHLHILYQWENYTLPEVLHIPKIQALIIDRSQPQTQFLWFIKSISPLFTIPINCNQIEGTELCRLIMLHRLSTPKYFKYGQFLWLI